MDTGRGCVQLAGSCYAFTNYARSIGFARIGKTTGLSGGCLFELCMDCKTGLADKTAFPLLEISFSETAGGIC